MDLLEKLFDLLHEADRRNLASQRLIRRLGMEMVGESGGGTCIHFRGSMKRILCSDR